MGLWAKQVLILFKIHWFYVKLKPLIAFMSLFGCVIASLSVMALFKFDVAIDDAKLNIIYMFFFATSPVFILIMGMVAETKRSKLFLSLRRLGIYESAFWFSAASIALVVSWISALMGVAVLTNIPMYDFIKRVDFLVLFLLQGTINMSMAFLALLLSSFFSDHHVTAIESAVVYITSLSTISRNFKYTGLCSFSCEYAENGLFTRIWKNVIWPSYNWSSAWQDIFIVTNPIADVKIPLDDQFFKVEDLFVSVYKRMDETYLRERIEIGFGVIKYDNDLLGAPTVFSLIYSLWIYVPILFFLAWYMHQLVEYQGYTLPWYFPFNKHYWTSVHTKDGVVTKSNTIELEGLTLEYSTKVSKAVDNFTNVMEPGNVYTILGHNGAGKTSLIGMLTGSIQPSSGKGSIFGFDIKSEVSQYLYLTGFCSQEDILVPNMTPFEHIEVFSGVRGIDMAPYGGFEKYCMQLLKKVQLEHVPHKRVDQFSGGMQRRLSFILSTIGDNRVYYLDEPTTGLDPISRHYIWNVIQELKKTSIVVLTSHNMEEAEYLADKILVMVKGKLVAQGSPLSLKNTFANEYQLRLSPKNEVGPFKGIEHVNDWAISNLPGSFPVLATDKMVTIGVPRRDVDRLSDFLQILETENTLRWAVGDSSLEELFLRISADGFDVEAYKISQKEKADLPIIAADTLAPVVSFKDYLVQNNLTTKSQFEDVTQQKNHMTYTRVYSEFRSQVIAQTYKVYQFLINDSFANAIWFIFVFWQVGLNLAQMEKAPPSVGDPPQTDPVYLASPPFLQEMWLSLAGTFINGTRAANCLLFFYFRYSSLIVAERSKGLLEVQEIQGMVKKAYWTATYLNGMVLNGFWILGCSLFLILFSYVELTYTLPLDLILICHVAVCMSIFVASFLQKSQNVILIWLLLWFIMNFGTELPIGFSLFPMIGVFNFLNNVGYQLPLFQSPRFLTFVGSWIVLFIGVIVADFSQFYGQFMKMVSKPSKTQRKMAEVKLQLDLDEREASIIAEEKTIDELESEGIYPETESLRLVHLTKQYRDKLAVNNISLRVKKNETFGIIGPNGAGKSTTFKMIYNAEKPTSGVVYLDSKYGNHGYVGVCQQKDIFWDYLTVLEHLKFYSLMNGVPENQLEEWVEYICKLALLHKDIWQCVPFMLSGGMKRRLSIAISIVGKRDTIILDEPSAGLDPGTRIKLWKTIEQLRTDDSKSVVLTTHLMDEAEALCDRIGIINYGKLIALGTSAELKALYGNMLKLNILAIVKKDHDKSIEETCKLRVDAISHATVSELDSKAVLIRQSLALRKNGEEGHMYLQFGIVKDGTSDMISLLKKVDPFCAKNGISEFGFSETTLDEVFLYVMANLK